MNPRWSCDATIVRMGKNKNTYERVLRLVATSATSMSGKCTSRILPELAVCKRLPESFKTSWINNVWAVAVLVSHRRRGGNVIVQDEDAGWKLNTGNTHV